MAEIACDTLALALHPRHACAMTDAQPNNPLHGLTLEHLVVKLVEHYGWEGLAQRISINCFRNDPSVKSSLKFLRRTPWAREQLEQLYLTTFKSPTPWPGRGAS